ncbi:uncharacterized protein LOC127138018 [Lathyrus oleraceus]|uniref:uncharacterized protein LOC127138018 n=1 Tax=Pisum sativum TaxID=3888 RepID=UPI0021D3A980|nr:uncharacterized protein LOC127138018 [Pisum sativum]
MDQMSVYAKFMKELLYQKQHLRDDENVVLAEECSDISQRKVPPKLTDPGRFTISCSIRPVKVDQALRDLEASINLMQLSMMKRLQCGDPKSTHMTLTLDDHSVTYPCGILEDVLVKVDDLIFSADFVILDMPEDVKTPLILGRPFLEIGRSLIDVELWGIELRFSKERVVFNVFEATKHPQCYKVRKLLQSLKKWTPKKEKFRVEHMVRWWKSRLKGLLSVFRCKEIVPYII